MAKDLDKVLSIDGTDYNINAVEATKVQKSLKLKKRASNSTTTSNFNGEAEIEIDYVPGTGGVFSGPISVPSNTGNTISDRAVLNYKDLKEKVFEEFVNNSAIYDWNGNNWESLDLLDTNGAINGISIIRGEDTATARTAFAITNSQKKKFLSYFYIGTSDPYNIYFGTSDNTVMTRLATNAGSAANAVTAETANRLTTQRKVKINLGTTSTTGVDFDGSKDVTLGVYGTLQPARGGTGQTNLDNVIVGKAKQLNTARTIKTNLSSSVAANFNGAANITPGVTGTLPPGNGGTGQTSLSNVTVGKSDAVKVSLKTADPSNADNILTAEKYPSITISLDTPEDTIGQDGDIWIKYSKSNQSN